MVARGDLGVEMPAEEVPLLQKELIRKANTLGIPIITATQMLDSMASNPRPTRAEVSDVANAILDGTDAVMLSNETAVGDYPVEAVETMATIARRIERDYPLKAIESHLPSTIPNAISAAVSNIARQLDAGAIIPLTKSGSTARNVSKFRPPTPILATTTERSVARRLQLVWGANMNFERLRFVAERSSLGEYKEAMFAVEIPEKAGSLISFCSLLNNRNLTEFSYRMSNSVNAQIFVGIEVNGLIDKEELLQEFKKSNYPFIDISNDELSKNHLRHMVGGRLPQKFTELEKSKCIELLYRFEFPERPGALINFLKNMKSNWTISIFHYRNHGSDVGKIVIGVLIDSAEINYWHKFVEFLGYKYWDETNNQTYKLFLGASD